MTELEKLTKDYLKDGAVFILDLNENCLVNHIEFELDSEDPDADPPGVDVKFLGEDTDANTK